MPIYHAGKSPDDGTKQALTGDVGRACAAAASGEIGFLRRARVDWGDVLRKAVARRFVDRQTASSVQCRRYGAMWSMCRVQRWSDADADAEGR